MNMPIDSSSPRLQQGGAAPPGALDEASGSAELRLRGSPDALLGEIMLLLEDNRERETFSRQEANRARLEHAGEAIDEAAKQAKRQLAVGLCNAVASAAEGVAPSSFNGHGDLISGLGKAAGQVGAASVGQAAAKSEQASRREGLQASVYQQISDESASARSEADRSAARVYDVLQEIGRLRAEAASAALRA